MKNFIYWLYAKLGISKAARKIERGKLQAWYGRVNAWPKDRSITVKDLNAMKKYGLSGYMIELSGWNRYRNKQWTDKWLSEVKSEYTWLVKQCRARGLWLFVSVVNDNMGQNKYGDTGPKLEKVYSKAQELVKIIKGVGASNVIVQPVAETQTSAGKKFEQYCIQQLGGKFQLIYNANGGSPSNIAPGFNFRAIHPSAISKKVAADAFAISDHGLIIRELAVDGGLESKGNPTKIAAWKQNVKSWGCPVIGYYAFKYDKFDEAAIKAMGGN